MGWRSGDFFHDRLNAPDLSAVEAADLQLQLTQFSNDPAIQDLLAATVADAKSSHQSRLVALNAMARADLEAAPVAWTKPILQILRSPESDLVRSGIAAARVLTLSKAGSVELDAALRQIGEDAQAVPETRLEALAAAGTLENLSPDLFTFLVGNVDPAKPWGVRNNAAVALGKAKLDRSQLLLLADALRTVGPLELAKLLNPFAACDDEAVGARLVENLKTAKAVSSLRPETVQPKLTKFPDSVQQKAAQLYALLNSDAGKQKEHLDQLMTQLPQGDIRRGQAIFNSPKALCSSCHAIGYLGGHVGPDLTSVGTIRTPRDLLESIVYPSASFVRSFEPMVVITKDGEQYTGVLKKDAADEVILVTGPDAEARIARANIAEMRQGSVSIMPQGLDEQLTHQELSDLLAFLKKTRGGAQ